MSKNKRRFWNFRGCENCPCKPVDKKECYRDLTYVTVKFMKPQYEKVDGEVRMTFDKYEIAEGRAIIVGKICYCIEVTSSLVPGLRIRIALKDIKVKKLNSNHIWTDTTHTGTSYFF